MATCVIKSKAKLNGIFFFIRKTNRMLHERRQYLNILHRNKCLLEREWIEGKMALKLKEIAGDFSIVRLNPDDSLPSWVMKSTFFSVVKTSDELSCVCESVYVPDQEIKKNEGWKCLRVDGVLDFSLTGILASLTEPLAKEKISVFAISTFDTDYLLIKKENFHRGKEVLKNAGFQVIEMNLSKGE